MIYATEDSAGRLAADALHLAIYLDSFTTLDWVERIGPAVQRATLTFADLERRHALLAMRRADDPVIDWVLDTIDVRLNTTCRINAAVPRPRRSMSRITGCFGPRPSRWMRNWPLARNAPHRPALAGFPQSRRQFEPSCLAHRSGFLAPRT